MRRSKWCWLTYCLVLCVLAYQPCDQYLQTCGYSSTCLHFCSFQVWPAQPKAGPFQWARWPHPYDQRWNQQSAELVRPLKTENGTTWLYLDFPLLLLVTTGLRTGFSVGFRLACPPLVELEDEYSRPPTLRVGGRLDCRSHGVESTSWEYLRHVVFPDIVPEGSILSIQLMEAIRTVRRFVDVGRSTRDLQDSKLSQQDAM